MGPISAYNKKYYSDSGLGYTNLHTSAQTYLRLRL